MSISDRQDALAKAVESTSSVLTALGFTIRRLDGLQYLAESANSRVYIADAITSVKTAIGPLPLPHGLLHSEPHGFVELHWLLELFATEIDESDQFPKPARTEADILAELDRQMRMLVDYCMPLLKGDCVAWEKVRKFMRDLGGLMQGAAESDSRYVDRLRELADTAWNKKTFLRLCSIYDVLFFRGAKLGLRDHYRWFQARRHRFLIG